MEQTIIINGKTYIIPAARVSALVAWLDANAVDTSKAKIQQVREITNDGNTDPRELLLETKKCRCNG